MLGIPARGEKEFTMERMKNLAYYNGRITPIEDMMIPANDRGFYFGDGIYEVAMVYNHKIFALEDHLERMARDRKSVV